MLHGEVDKILVSVLQKKLSLRPCFKLGLKWLCGICPSMVLRQKLVVFTLFFKVGGRDFMKYKAFCTRKLLSFILAAKRKNWDVVNFGKARVKPEIGCHNRAILTLDF